MADTYCPDLATFCDILGDYSRHGLSYYKEQTRDTQQKLRAAVQGKLEDDERKISYKLASIKKGGQPQLHFLPMPKPAGKDFKASFFLPRIFLGDNSNFSCSFTVIFWIEKEQGKTISIRFEPSAEAGNAHAYPHAQLTRTVIDPNVTTSFEQWIPTSYPALPLGYDKPLHLFVGMVVAVHGYSANDRKEYARAAIEDAMARGQAAQRAPKILSEMKRILER